MPTKPHATCSIFFFPYSSSSQLNLYSPLRERHQRLLFLRFLVTCYDPLTLLLFLQMHLPSKEKASLLFLPTLFFDHMCLPSRTWAPPTTPFPLLLSMDHKCFKLLIQKHLTSTSFPLQVSDHSLFFEQTLEGSSVLYPNIPKAHASSCIPSYVDGPQ